MEKIFITTSITEYKLFCILKLIKQQELNIDINMTISEVFLCVTLCSLKQSSCYLQVLKDLSQSLNLSSISVQTQFLLFYHLIFRTKTKYL